MQRWIEEVETNTTTRPEGNAAREILEQIATAGGLTITNLYNDTRHPHRTATAE